ncbi:MAG: HpcH/HpaI aldolase/citrate lyase family protein [Oceanicaulis sp.]
MRSLLFVPGSRPDRIAKALEAGADAVCVDLEDAVAPDAKDQARQAVLSELSEDGRFAVRVNPLETEWGREDADALAGHTSRAAFVMLPKAESAGQIDILSAALGPAGDGGIVPIIESAAALPNAYAIAAAQGVKAVLFGGGDMAADLGVAMDFEPLLFARAQVVAACAAANVPAIDVPWLDVKDEAGLLKETERVKALGFTAKACIHPAQVSAVNHVFTPGEDEISHAERVIAALDQAGGGAALLDGKLIEAPIIRRARRVLETARQARPH